MAKSAKPQVLSENLLRQIFKQSGDTFPKLADGRKYFKYNGFSYVETAEGSGRMVPSGRQLGKYNMTLRQLYSGKVDPGVRARTEADSARFAAEREAKAGTAPKRPVGRPRKDGTPAQSKKVKTDVPAKGDIATRDAAMTNKTLAELGPDKPKTPKKSLGKGGAKPKTAPIGGPKAPPRKPKAPAKPKIDRSAEKPLTSRSSGLSDAELKAKLEAAKFKVETAPKTKSKAPKAPAKGKTPATGSKPSTTSSKPRNRAPKVEKPVSPRLEMKSEFSKIKRNIETSIRQGERKAAKKAAKPTPSLKADSAPKRTSTGPKAQPRATTPSSAPKRSTTTPRAPRGTSAANAAAVRAVDAEMAKVNADFAAGKITKAQRNAAAKANAARRAAAMKGELPGSSVVKSGGVKTVKEGVRRPTVSKSSGKAVVPRTPSRGASGTQSRLALTSGKGNVVKVNGKLFRVVGKTLEPLAIGAMLYDKAQDPLGKKEIARAQAWKKANPNASLWDATVASVKDVFGFEDAPARKPSTAKKATPRKPISPASKNVRPRGESYTPSTSKSVRPRNESYTPPKRKTPVAPRGPQKPSGSSSSNYTPRGSVRIKRGDTLWDLAQKNNTTVAAIYRANPELARRKAAGKVQIFRNTLVKIPGKK